MSDFLRRGPIVVLVSCDTSGVSIYKYENVHIHVCYICMCIHTYNTHIYRITIMSQVVVEFYLQCLLISRIV